LWEGLTGGQFVGCARFAALFCVEVAKVEGDEGVALLDTANADGKLDFAADRLYEDFLAI
jgi:hypothetical protein